MTTNLFGKLLDLLGDQPGGDDDAAQQEREALVDLLVWTMFVDRHVARAERSYLAEQGRGLKWEGVYELDLYIDASTRRVRDALGSETAEAAYLEHIVARLGDEQARARALEACQALAEADGDLAPAEEAHLERLRAALLG